MRALTRTRRLRSCAAQPGDDGALSLVYVIIFPAFLSIILVMAQAAFWFLAAEGALSAARAGADAARRQGSDLGNGPPAALAFARQIGSGFLRKPAANSSGSSAITVEITVTGEAASLVPGMIIHVSETVQAPREQFIADSATRAAIENPDSGEIR